MKNINKSHKVFIILILILAVSAAIMSTLPVGIEVQGMNTELPAAPWVIALANFFIMIIVYGGLGLLGLFLAKKTIIPDLWSDKINNKQRFFVPLIVGIICGILMIASDQMFFHFTELDKIPHPKFPASFFASVTAGIGEEIVFRLFFISFWLWLIGKVLLKGKAYNTIFWILAFFSIIIFTAAHLPSIMLIYGIESFEAIPLYLGLELLLLNGIVSIGAIWFFKKYGILAAIGIHLWADIVWHMIYGYFM